MGLLEPAIAFVSGNLTLVLIAAVLAIAIKYFNLTDVPRIKGIPEVPGIPVFGNLIALGDKHALSCQKWAKQYGPVFQVRMGNRRVVVANSFKSVRELWITNQSALISRPTLYTFHTVVSSSQGFTIGTSPWDESCKLRRKVAATALNRPAVASYMPIINLESYAAIRDMFVDGEGGKEVDPKIYFQRFALNTSLSLNYGFRCEGGINDKLLHEIIEVENAISRFRSTSNNWIDYIPLFRLVPAQFRQAAPVEYRERRDKYLDKLIGDLRKRIADGTDIPCITGNILKDPEAKLTEAEVKSICLTMVSAGLDTVPANIIQGIGYLSTNEGQEVQKRLYDEIMAVYPYGDAWEKCLTEERVPYVTAFVKEVLRFFTVIPICLPRRSIKDIQYNGATIPAGTSFYMNAYAADYDEEYFDDPYTFNPERYMVENKNGFGAEHYSYGAGSRMCAGSHLANREQFVAYVRFVMAFKVSPPANKKDLAIVDCLESNACPTALVAEAKDFKVKIEPRNKEMLTKWLETSKEQTDFMDA
jgi:phenylacetate 2-hydroxylase